MWIRREWVVLTFLLPKPEQYGLNILLLHREIQDNQIDTIPGSAFAGLTDFYL
jgi:hypothetical protein